jgi:hypothetical protein
MQASLNAWSTSAGSWGWYLYGITYRCAEPGTAPSGEKRVNLTVDPWIGNSDHIQSLGTGSLAAIVRPVLLSEFELDAVRAHSSDTEWLESMVRAHNQVITALHQEQAILPAKFGAVYPRTDALLAALDRHQQFLLDELQHLDGCDEWALHLYADSQGVQQRVAAEHPAIRHLEAEIAAGTPGKAFFLRRKLADEVAGVALQVLSDLGQEAYDRLARLARDGQVNRLAPSVGPEGETEILRAAFLVPRSETEAFLAEIGRLTEHDEGLRTEVTGPWPPYSFAVLDEEQLQ